MENIVMLYGSGRLNGNSHLLGKAFKDNVDCEKYHIDEIDCVNIGIKPCKACLKCYTNGKACLFDDEFNKIASILENADAIVFVTPLYWFGFSGALKIVFDKYNALGVGHRNRHIVKSALLSCGETDDIQDFAALKANFEAISHYKKWEIRGEVCALNCDKPGDVQNTEYINQTILIAKNF